MTQDIKTLMTKYQNLFDTYLETLDKLDYVHPSTVGHKRVMNTLSEISTELRKIDTQITIKIHNYAQVRTNQ